MLLRKGNYLAARMKMTMMTKRMINPLKKRKPRQAKMTKNLNMRRRRNLLNYNLRKKRLRLSTMNKGRKIQRKMLQQKRVLKAKHLKLWKRIQVHQIAAMSAITKEVD